jgi:glycosyltransferase involved in cell wall biosynthesis
MNWPLYAGGLLAATWFYHSIAASIGIPKVPELSTPEWDLAPDQIVSLKSGAKAPKVSVIVPARNEARSIGAAMRTLMRTDYPNVEIIAVNDRSTDDTGAILEEVARESAGRLKVIHIAELPSGWLGKTHAMNCAAEQALGEWILFTDADVHHRTDSLRRAIAYAESSRADHLVLLPNMLMHSWGERMMISFFQALFIFAHRPWKVADPKAKDHIGVGAFNLIRRSTYDAIGGYGKLRLAVVDDMKLGEMVKRNGFASRVAFGKDLIRIRWAHGALGMMNNLVKNFFAVLRYNVLLSILAALAVLVLHLGPWIGAIFAHGIARIGFVISLVCVFGVYSGMSKRSGVKSVYAISHPLAAILLVFTILRSTFVTVWQGGVTWRGTKYSLEELRRSGL